MKRKAFIALAAVVMVFSACLRDDDLALLKKPIHLQGSMDPSVGVPAAYGRMTIHDLMAYNGIGEAKAISILAACELGKRRQAEDVLLRPAFTSAQDIYDLMRNEL